jgi:acyl-CoA synthetase (AMP-forming)/AMP-acid ligase II
VAEVAVVGKADPRWGETVAAVVRPSPDTAPSEEELRVYCRDHLGRLQDADHLASSSMPYRSPHPGRFARTSYATNSPRSPPDVHASEPVTPGVSFRRPLSSAGC